jgi:hypothetical protein
MWGQSWVKHYDEGAEWMKYLLIATALVLYALTIRKKDMLYLYILLNNL